MDTKKTTFILAALCLYFRGTSIAQNRQKDSVFVLDGRISKPIAKGNVYLVYQVDGRRFIDSSTVINQQFHFKGLAVSPVFATLAMDHEGRGMKYTMKKAVDDVDALRFYLHSGNISLNINDSIATAKFTISAINQDYAKLQVMLNINAEHELYRLSAQMQKLHTPESEKRYVAFHDSLNAAHLPVLKAFVKQNPESYIALVALQEYAGAFPDTADVRPLFKLLSPGVRNTKAGIELDILINNKVMVGAIAPDFTQNTPEGKPLALSSLRGKFVLIDFWASWCPSCREENPALVKVYNHLKDKNFTILGVSLDGQGTRAAWIKAISDDGLTWPQVSDLKHWDNTVSKIYGINAIPQNVLIDAEGRVIAKNIEPSEIMTKLEQVAKTK